MPPTTIPAVHTILDAKPLGVEIRRRWQLPDPFHCELFVRGMNDVYLVKTADKISRSGVGAPIASWRRIKNWTASGCPGVSPIATSTRTT